MSVSSFGDPGEPRYEVYDGPLEQSVIVRIDGHLLGVAHDRDHALRIVIADVRRRREASRGTFWMMAA